VAKQRLQHYLRTYRRRSGFSQEEIAQLLGASSGTKVSRYESFRRCPSVITVFAYEVIFNQPARELFAGFYDGVHQEVRQRAERLAKALAERDTDPETVRKLVFLRRIVDPKTNQLDGQ